MVDTMRAALDELMGKERNVPLGQRSGSKIRFTDSLVCKHEIAGLCPNRLFKNTRSDLGPCEFEIHSDHIDWEAIVSDWNKLDDREKERYGYQRDLYRYLDSLIRDMDKKIAKAKERAEKESAPREPKPEDQARLMELQAKAKDCLEKSQRAGEDGNVDAAMALAQQADLFKQQHDNLLRNLTMPERTMTVCEICGVFINSTDNEQRHLDHLTGKQYLGWKKIRETYAEMKEKMELKSKGSVDRRSREPEPRRERERSPPRVRSPERRRTPTADGYKESREPYRGGYERESYDRPGYDKRGYGGGAEYGGSYGSERGYARPVERGYERAYDEREEYYARDRGGYGGGYGNEVPPPPRDGYSRGPSRSYGGYGGGYGEGRR